MTDNSKSRKPLLSDEEFAELMEAEFHQEQPVTDDLAKHQVYQQLQQRLFNKTAHKKRLPYFNIAAVVALIAIGVVAVMQLVPTSDTRIKGNSLSPSAQLSVFSLGEHGELHASDGTHDIGSRLVFKISSADNAFAALISTVNSGNVQVRFTAAISAGNDLLLQRNGNTYAYLVEPTDKQLKFCLVTAKTEKALTMLLEKTDDKKLPESICRNILISEKS